MLVAVEMGGQLCVGELLGTENEATDALKTIVGRLEQESGEKYAPVLGTRTYTKSSLTSANATLCRTTTPSHSNKTALPSALLPPI